MNLLKIVPGAVLALGMVFVACADDDDPPAPAINNNNNNTAPDPVPTAISIDQMDVVAEVNRPTPLTVTGTFEDGTTGFVVRGLEWSSSDESVATVGVSGTVIGVSGGTAVITASINGLSDSIDVRVGNGNTSGIPLPMVVDDNFRDRSAFVDGTASFEETLDCPMRGTADAVGNCHRIKWDGTGGAFLGSFWTSGSDFANLEGKRVAPGATEVSFYAWGTNGGEQIVFGAGIIDATADGTEDRATLTLTTTPTRYSVPLTALAGYTDVFGAFIWAADNTLNPSGVEFFIDDIQWRAGDVTPTEIPLPMVVDDNYPDRSGFGPDGPSLHTEDNTCPTRAGGESGSCHRFTWDGMGGGFTGTFWTVGEGFMGLRGLQVEQGATEVSFWAWGASGDEVIAFGAGIANTDVGEDRVTINLTTTPTMYTVPLTNLAAYTEVFGAFVWSADNQGANADGFEFYVDDIRWTKGDVTPTEIPLPMVVDDNYPDRSGFGPDGPPLHMEDAMCPTRAGDEEGACHRFTWNGMGGGFTGTFWTVGGGFQDLQGLAVEPGATEVSFWAWGANGDEVIAFGAGLAGSDVGEDRRTITLSTTPTLYTVPLNNLASYANVFGAFIWSANNEGANADGFEFYVDDIQWKKDEQVPLPLPMVVDDNYPDRSAFGPDGPPLHAEDDQCPTRAGDEDGICHRFTWDGTGGTFTGAFWTIGTAFQALESRVIEPGATQVSFYAWSRDGGDSIAFGAGLGGSDIAEDRQTIVLTTTPTRYTVPLTNLASYNAVFGAFIWSANNEGANADGFEFYVDDIKWQGTPPPTAERVVFDDDYATGVAFAPFGGSVNDITIDTTNPQSGMAALKIAVPAANGFTGGALKADAELDLSGFNALQFWARADADNPLNVTGIGDDASNALNKAEFNGVPLTSTWQQFTIPIPSPGTLTAEDGLFHFAEGPEHGAYNIWLDEIKYVQLPGGVITNPRPAFATQDISQEVGTTFTPVGNAVVFNVDGQDQTIVCNPPYFNWTSNNTNVATIDSNGVGMAVAVGTATITGDLDGVAAGGRLRVDVTPTQAPTTPAPTPPARAAADVVSLFSDAYTNITVDTFSAGWDRADVNDQMIGADNVKRYTNHQFAGIEFFRNMNSIDATSMTHIHVDMWTSGTNRFAVRLVNFAMSGNTESTVEFTPMTTPAVVAGQWISFDIPLTAFMGLPARDNISQILLLSNEAVPETLFIDNLYFYK